MTVGQKLRAARQRRQLSQRKVAKELGVAQPTVHSWEHDSCSPKPERMRDVARVYGLKLEDLLPRAA